VTPVLRSWPRGTRQLSAGDRLLLRLPSLGVWCDCQTPRCRFGSVGDEEIQTFSWAQQEGTNPLYSLIGLFGKRIRLERWGPGESRGSRRVLREAEGEILSAYSTQFSDGVTARDVTTGARGGLGTICKCVRDLDALILHVNSRTLKRLDAARTASIKPIDEPATRLVRPALAYLDFANENINVWSALFKLRTPTDWPVPDWHILEHHACQLFAMIGSTLSEHHLTITEHALLSPLPYAALLRSASKGNSLAWSATSSAMNWKLCLAHSSAALGRLMAQSWLGPQNAEVSLSRSRNHTVLAVDILHRIPDW
jgi:hypothetical protein